MNIQDAQFAGGTYVGLRKKISFSEMTPEYFQAAYGKLNDYCEKHNVQILGAPVCVYYIWDEEGQTTELMPAFKVADGAQPEDDLTVEKLPESAAMVGDHMGNYDNLKAAHMEMWDSVQKAEKEFNEFVMEEYLVGPPMEPDMAKWHTKLWYLVK